MKYLIMILAAVLSAKSAFARNSDLLNKALDSSLRERTAVQRAYGAQVPKEDTAAPAQVDKSIKIDVGDDLGGTGRSNTEVGMAFRSGRDASKGDDYRAQIQEIEKTISEAEKQSKVSKDKLAAAKKKSRSKRH